MNMRQPIIHTLNHIIHVMFHMQVIILDSPFVARSPSIPLFAKCPDNKGHDMLTVTQLLVALGHSYSYDLFQWNVICLHIY